jgi:glycosyltransferase involved in cell wall biosynthesis
MPVHNAMPFLGAAIEAILQQSFGDFEFIIGDDCSTDGSADCALAFASRDSRIRVIRSTARLGPVGSSNWVAREARAPIVARMDADDLCHPRRLELQVQALARHPLAVMVGSLYSLIDRFDRPIRPVDRSVLLGRRIPPIAHSSIVYRKSAFDQVGGYCCDSDYFEDAELYRRLMRIGEILVIADDLVLYRFAGTSARLKDDQAEVELALNAMPAMLRLRKPPNDASGKLEPEVFRTFGGLRLWANLPPGILIPMAKRMRIRPLSASLHVIIWAIVCSLSPPLARQATRMRLAWGNWRVRARIPAGYLFRWLPGEPAVNLGRVDQTSGE